VGRSTGFGAYIGPCNEEREALLRVARDCARAPVAESRLRYDAERAEVELVAGVVGGEERASERERV